MARKSSSGASSTRPISSNGRSIRSRYRRNGPCALDADEIVEPDLAAEIEAKLGALPPAVTAVNLKRKTIFMDRWIRHGGRYPLTLLRIWRSGKAHVEDRWMDEHMLLDEGRAVTFEGGFADHNLHDLGRFTAKHNGYATREAVQLLLERHVLRGAGERPLASVTPQAALKRMAKNNLYGRTPFPLDALAYFLYRYVLRGGFLDGREGVIYHVLQGFWYRFLVGAKLIEFRRGLHGVRDPEAARAILARLSGLHLE